MEGLSDIASIYMGLPPPRQLGSARYALLKDLNPSRRDLVRAAEPESRRATPIEPGDVLIASRGEGPLAHRPDPELLGAYVGLDIYLVRPDERRLDPDFLAALLNWGPAGASLRATASRGVLPRISKAEVDALPIPRLPLETQRHIGALDAARARSEALLEAWVAAERRLLGAVIRAVTTTETTKVE